MKSIEELEVQNAMLEQSCVRQLCSILGISLSSYERESVEAFVTSMQDLSILRARLEIRKQQEELSRQEKKRT